MPLQAIRRIGTTCRRPLVGGQGAFFDEKQVSATLVSRNGPTVLGHGTLVGTTNIEVTVAIHGHGAERDGLIGDAVAGDGLEYAAA